MQNPFFLDNFQYKEKYKIRFRIRNWVGLFGYILVIEVYQYKSTTIQKNRQWWFSGKVSGPFLLPWGLGFEYPLGTYVAIC